MCDVRRDSAVGEALIWPVDFYFRCRADTLRVFEETIVLPGSLFASTTISLTMTTPTVSIDSLLEANAQWAADVLKAEPDFFTNSAKGQSPHVRACFIFHFQSFLLTFFLDPLDRMRRLQSSRLCNYCR